MGKAAETLDHLPVPQGVVAGIVEGFVLHLAGQRREQRYRALLVEHGVTVLEGEVGEPALKGREVLVAAGGDQRFRDLQGLCITREGPWRAAKNVAGELVEQQDRRQQVSIRLFNRCPAI